LQKKERSIQKNVKNEFIIAQNLQLLKEKYV
jgi:hypothetical protein